MMAITLCNTLHLKTTMKKEIIKDIESRIQEANLKITRLNEEAITEVEGTDVLVLDVGIYLKVEGFMKYIDDLKVKLKFWKEYNEEW